MNDPRLGGLARDGARRRHWSARAQRRNARQCGRNGSAARGALDGICGRVRGLQELGCRTVPVCRARRTSRSLLHQRREIVMARLMRGKLKELGDRIARHGGVLSARSRRRCVPSSRSRPRAMSLDGTSAGQSICLTNLIGDNCQFVFPFFSRGRATYHNGVG